MVEQAERVSYSRVATAVSMVAAAAAGIAVLALAGWVTGMPALAGWLPGEPAMNPMTSIGIILAAAALWVLRSSGSGGLIRNLALVCAGLVAGIGALRLLALRFGIASELDHVILQAQLAASGLPTRMAPNTAFALVCMGLGLLLVGVRSRHGWRLAAPLLFAGLAISIVSLVGYAYRVAPMRGVMAVSTACAMFLLFAGALAVRPDRGLFGLLMRPSAGGVMARRLLPTAAVLPFVLAWLRLEGQRAGLYGLELGTAMLAMAIVALLVGLIWMTALRLDAAEQERRHVEEELKKSLDRQSRLLELNVIGVLTANIDGWIKEANPAFLQMIGYGREELPLRTERVTPPEWLAQNEHAVQQIVGHGVATPFEKEYVHKDGHRVPALVGAAAVPGTDGEVMAFVVDLSGKKSAEREIERMRSFLDSVIENLPDMVFVKDAAELRFVQFNRAGEELLGFPREDLMGKNDHDFFPKEQADFFIAKDRAVLTAREMLDIPEEEIQTKSGETRILHTKKVPILDRGGIPRFLLGISEDITDRKRAERELVVLNDSLRRRTAELEAVNRELEAFSYSVSHDLRAPLRHIDGFTDLLVRHAGPMLDDKGRRHLEVIARSAKSMGELIDDLLAFSRMSRTEMQRASVDLDKLVAEARRGLDGDTAGRNIQWSIAPLPAVQGDRGMLQVVFTNLLANAVKYSRPRRQALIEVGSRETGDEVIIFVRDNGVGFDMKYQHKLFGVFQRLHSDDDFEGTGIGLANVRRVIQRHGGRTWAEGEIDVGATFYIALPRVPAVDEAREAA
jgi:PAS domain S-box-containing protein